MSACLRVAGAAIAVAMMCGPAFADVLPPPEKPPQANETKPAPADPQPAPVIPDATIDQLLGGDAAANASGAPAEEAKDPSPSPEEARANSLVKRYGAIDLPGGQAKVAVADGFAFLDAADTKTLLIELWGNPQDAVSNVIGAIVPADVSVLAEGSWAAIITYENDGHVTDDDAATINYDELLSEMQAATAADSEARVKAGYEAISLVGWAQKPSYDVKEHKLYWAKHLQFGKDVHTLNYAIRALGRSGVLQVNVVGDMRQLDDINAQLPKLLSMVSFNEGHRYADYQEGVDPLAAGGLAALIAGGAAAKAGLLKGLIAILAASWKFIAIGLVAFGGLIWRMFSNRSKEPSA